MRDTLGTNTCSCLPTRESGHVGGCVAHYACRRGSPATIWVVVPQECSEIGDLSNLACTIWYLLDTNHHSSSVMITHTIICAYSEDISTLEQKFPSCNEILYETPCQVMDWCHLGGGGEGKRDGYIEGSERCNKMMNSVQDKCLDRHWYLAILSHPLPPDQPQL